MPCLRSLLCNTEFLARDLCLSPPATFAGAIRLLNGELSFSKMLFVDTPPRRRRLPAFAGSTVLHCVAIFLMTVLSVDAPRKVHSTPRRYSVRFLQLQMPRQYRAPALSGAGRSAGAEFLEPARPQASASQSRGSKPAHSGASQLALAQPDTPREHREFKLPPNTRVQVAIKQTLVQLDVPPDVVLKHEIPLPTIVMWTQTEPPPPMRKRFIAPALRKPVPKIAQSLPQAPALDPPNREVDVANLSVASTLINDTPRLLHPPTIASPVSRAAQEPAKQIPEIAPPTSTEASAANLISLPETPMHSATVLVLPPANQIASDDRASAGPVPGDGGAEHAGQGSRPGDLGSGATGSGPGQSGTEGQGNGGNGSTALAGGNNGAGSGSSGLNGGTGSGGNGSGGAAASGNGAGGTGSSGYGTGTSGNGTGASGTGSGAGGSGNPLGTGMAGLTRIALPKEGRYGVIVLGSADSAQYPESVGALSGKVVYTVYLKVGLRKSWILQYCLPKAAEQKVPVKRGATPIDAPWPFLIMRPEAFGPSDPDYIMVHGMLTTDGQFDQLAMVFPEELSTKDLLLHSLKLWAFRPASRDGEPVPVEVLLIIPRQQAE